MDLHGPEDLGPDTEVKGFNVHAQSKVEPVPISPGGGSKAQVPIQGAQISEWKAGIVIQPDLFIDGIIVSLSFGLLAWK
jgi:hypothetical protein